MVKHHFCIIIAQDALFKVPTFLFIYCIRSSKEEPFVRGNNSTELHPVLELALRTFKSSV